MAQWPLIPKQAPHQGRGHHAHRAQLPVFYMNDYSLLGLRVDPCDAALRVLAENCYRVVQDDGGCHVTLNGASEVQAAVALLNGHGVACDITDVADQIYQG
jgi:hypothetical protein